MDSSEQHQRDIALMKLAILEAKKCVPADTAFNVGAVLVAADGSILESGYSRELPNNTHAEENCLLKLMKRRSNQNFRGHSDSLHSFIPKDLAKGATIYSTMEPCGERLSGKRCCASLLIDAGVKRIVQGTKEPSNFITAPAGGRMLKEKGIIVDYLIELDGECAALN
jgi:pyrimidine deaminase RibD-like protein